ncbi:MAG: hypothetical protein GEU79_10665 [Acidimicrobiia bacterium]|nr:hypothetical protein [Acidimicrobiia bacterium]
MAVTFLSEEWAQAVTDALNAHEGFKNSMGDADLSIQFVTTDTPAGGETPYYLAATGGNAAVTLGTAEGPDATVTQTYETATAISSGELNTQTAFMTGKLKVTGNLAKLMMHQNAIQQWGSAVSDIQVDY